MHTVQKKTVQPLWAAIGALSVSLLITSEVGLLLFCVGFTLPEGMFRTMAFVLAGIGTLVFFVRFLFHAYKVELEIMGEVKNPQDLECY